MSNTEKRPAHTPGPWWPDPDDVLNDNRAFGIIARDDAEGSDGDATQCVAEVCDGPTAQADAYLIAAAPSLLEAIKVQHECGAPSKVSLYDGEGVEGWKWTHPDGREWVEAGDWSAPPPMHPVAREAIARAEGGAE